MASGDCKRYSLSNSSSSKKQKTVSTEETDDRISQLPEPLLVQILSFSRTKDAFSTCLVSKSWFNLWTFVDSFNFTTRDFLKSENSVVGSFAEYALAHSVSPNIKMLKLKWRGCDPDDSTIRYLLSRVNRCLSFAVKKHVENVVIHGNLVTRCPLPRSFYTCSSLITLVLSRLCIKFRRVIEWKSLKSLKLEWSSLSDKDIVNLLAGCPALETIEFCMTWGFGRLDIKSLKLKRLIFSNARRHEKPLEICAPYLQHLEISGDLEGLKCRLVDVSSLVYAKLTFDIACIKDILDGECNGKEDSCYEYHQAFGILSRDNLQQLSTVTTLIIGAWFRDALCMLQLKGVPIPELKCKYVTLEESHILKFNPDGVAGLLQASPYVEALNINLEINFYNVFHSRCRFGLALRDDINLLSEISSSVFPKLKRVTIVMFFKRFVPEHFKALKRGFDKFFKLLEFLLKTAIVLEELVIISKGSTFSGTTIYLQKLAKKLLDCERSSTKSMIIFDGSKLSQAVGQTVPLKSNPFQSFEKKELPNQGNSKMTAGSAGFPPTQMGPRQGPSSRTVRSEPEICRGKTAPVFEDIKTKVKDEKIAGGIKKGVATPKVDRKSRKRGRKHTIESSESSDTATTVEAEDLDIESENGLSAGQGTGLDGTRRSSGRRQYVSYNETASEDENDLASSVKKARSNQSAGDDKHLKNEAVGGDDKKHANRSRGNSVDGLNQNEVGLPEGDVKRNKSKIGTVDEQASRPASGGAEKVELIVDGSDSEPDVVPEMYYYPDPEFGNFDKHKTENCFAVNQIWACYDTADGMPRFYAHIKKVSSPEFNIMFSWLEAYPEDKGGFAWVEADLPVGCGKFRRGSTEDTSDRLIFSHLVQCEMGMRGLYIVYPRKGETWALFKDWDINWSSDPENHQKYGYESVEILSDYVGDVGVQVGYLDKVSGYASLFQRTRLSEVDSFFVKPKELYKFSHRIPSFKMTGNEREGVPAGSFELDPDSLPVNPVDIWYPAKDKENTRTAHSEPAENVSSAVPPELEISQGCQRMRRHLRSLWT